MHRTSPLVIMSLLNMFLFSILVTLTTTIVVVNAHTRWTCPAARNPDTGIKGGPCGPNTNQFAAEPIMTIAPGPFTVQWEESITHVGAPFFIALSQDARDTDTFLLKSCILLDHIPHNDRTNPNFYDEDTFELYTLTIEIPDVSCERCSLHIINPMTDKIGDRGAPDGEGCPYPGFCGGIDVYHSCTLPIRITGRTPRQSYVCPNVQPTDWPTSWIGDGGRPVQATERLNYRRETGRWTDSYLQDVPNRYRSIAQASNSQCLNLTYTDPILRTSPPRITPRPLPTAPPSEANASGFFNLLLRLISSFLSFFAASAGVEQN